MGGTGPVWEQALATVLFLGGLAAIFLGIMWATFKVYRVPRKRRPPE